MNNISLGDFDNAFKNLTPADSFVDARGPNAAPQVDLLKLNDADLEYEITRLQERYGINREDSIRYVSVLGFQQNGETFARALASVAEVEALAEVQFGVMLEALSASLPIAS